MGCLTKRKTISSAKKAGLIQINAEFAKALSVKRNVSMRKASKVRIVNRCSISGRAQGVMRSHRMDRSQLRLLIDEGIIP